jgi:circadian clock protein KaiC
MHEEKALMLQMHELLSYLSHQGVLSILIVGQSGLLDNVGDPLDIAFISDTVILMRYFEAEGEVRKAISIVKKRPGRHESSIREFSLTSAGVAVGPQLGGFEGVLTGVPRAAQEDSDPPPVQHD